MDCRDIRKKLSDGSGGPVPPDDKVLIDRHLRDCVACTEYAAEIRKTIETLQGLDEIEPPAWLTEKVMKKIRTEVLPKKSWLERLFFPLHIKLPLEAFAALLITVAAIFIYKNMGPELEQMKVQPQAPETRSIPAEQEKEILKKEIQQPQRLREEAKYKDSSVSTESQEMTTFKEEKRLEQKMAPAPASSAAPSSVPSSATRQIETGKASGMAARDEMMQRAAPAAPRSELSAENKAEILATVTVTVKVLDSAKKEIETYIARSGGELKTIEQSESRIIITVKLDPAKTNKFVAHLGNLGTIKENLQAVSMQSGSFKLVIEKQ
jgi:hypothetical protein